MGCEGSKTLDVLQPKFKDNTNVVFVVGGPGSGKGTQCEKMAKKYGFHHISTGDLLRNEVKKKGPQGKVIEEIQKKGELVPSDILVKLIKSKMLALQKKNHKAFLLDGFPRSKENGDAWMDIIGQDVKHPILMYFSCPDDVLTARLLERGKASGRSDDNEEAIKTRLETFHANNQYAIDIGNQLNILKEIDSNRDIEAVWGDVCKIIDESSLMATPTA